MCLKFVLNFDHGLISNSITTRILFFPFVYSLILVGFRTKRIKTLLSAIFITQLTIGLLNITNKLSWIPQLILICSQDIVFSLFVFMWFWFDLFIAFLAFGFVSMNKQFWIGTFSMLALIYGILGHLFLDKIDVPEKTENYLNFAYENGLFSYYLLIYFGILGMVYCFVLSREQMKSQSKTYKKCFSVSKGALELRSDSREE